MHLFNFLLVFWLVVDLPIRDLLHVSLSSSIPILPSLKEDTFDKYLFYGTYTPSNERERDFENERDILQDTNLTIDNYIK